MNSNRNTWVLTDDDSLQYCREVKPNVFEFIEMGVAPEGYKSSHYYHRAIVSILERLEDEETVLDIVRAYDYDSIASIRALYGEDANRIIAECIFESEGPVNGGDHEVRFFNSEKACAAAIMAVVERG